ncbi:MAG: NAD-dependent epimerase/dehydratase family protein [Gemmatimonadales bacterium]|nr:NAD-dependent epimerase/dehydratase family protein [Gemmatimonadales bacterium]
MTLLVTGADGFAGRYLVRHLLTAGHRVVAAIGPGGTPPEAWIPAGLPGTVETRTLDLTDHPSIVALAHEADGAIVHLAAMSSGRAAQSDPGRAWLVNAAGTALLCDALARRSSPFRGRLLVVSTAEVYGARGERPRVEDDPIVPCSTYAATKAGGEIAALEAWRRTGLDVVVARPFPHTGPGQPPLFAVPAFLERLKAAHRTGSATVKTGNLTPVRDYLDVRDVVRAYVALLEVGASGEVYNIARGTGVPLLDVFQRLAALVGVAVEPETDPALLRPADITHLVGDPSKLRNASGWAPAIPFQQTLGDMVHAEAN